ncbi:ankyrin repeat-containing domain protein [Xylariomycetidae sp. FL0641]|nr:ankyrin repeat-containing domain protein [Xylariomycetidae sp. FL0641]
MDPRETQKLPEQRDDTERDDAEVSSGHPETTLAPSANASGPRKLPNDLIYYLVRNTDIASRDILALRRTCKDYDGLLAGVHHRKDILKFESNPETLATEIPHIPGGIYRGPIWSRQGMSALMFACARGDVEKVQYLISESARIFPGYLNARNDAGFSALHLAVYHNHIEAARLLLDAGCATANTAPYLSHKDVASRPHHDQDQCVLSITLPKKDARFAVTAFAIAIFEGHREMAELLAQYISVDERTRSCFTDGTEGLLFSALTLASVAKMPTVVRALLSHGHGPSTRDNNHKWAADPMYYAASVPDNQEIIDALLEHGGSLGSDNEPTTWAPIFAAIRRGRQSNALHLLHKETHVTNRLRKALLQSIMVTGKGTPGRLPVVKALIQMFFRFKDISTLFRLLQEEELCERSKIYPLHTQEAVQYLLHTLAFGKLPGDEESTCLHWVAKQSTWRHVGAVKDVLKHGEGRINLNAKDINGCTVMDLAGQHESGNLVRIFKKYGAKRDTKCISTEWLWRLDE